MPKRTVEESKKVYQVSKDLNLVVTSARKYYAVSQDIFQKFKAFLKGLRK